MNDPLLLAGGLTLLLCAGHALVRGAAGLAASFGVSPGLVGLTVVAFGTSAPELAVNGLAAARGQAEIAFGNVVGSNLANLGFVLGFAALIRPLTIEGKIVAREIPMMLLATAAVCVLGLDPDLNFVPDRYSRADGIVLLLFFSVFLYTAFHDVLRRQRVDPLVTQALDSPNTPPVKHRRGLDASLTLVGFVGLYFGGEFTVEGATGIARAAGLSDAVIGLTVVAIGTSLPEFVTTILATMKGQTDIAVGNVVGSNIFNLLFILGVSSSMSGVPVPQGGLSDLGILMGLSLILLPLAVTHTRRIVRYEGAIFFAAWIAYTSWRVMAAI